MKLTEAQLIEKAKAYAQQNYENGMDTFVECYDNDQWRTLINNSDEDTGEDRLMTWTQIKKTMDAIASVWRDRQADAEYHRRQAIGDPEKAAQVETVQLVKDCPEVEAAFRQVMKDVYGQSYLFDMHLEMPVKEAWEFIHHLQHLND